MVCSCGKSYLSEVQDVILEMMFLDRMPPRTFVWLHQNPPECANKSLRNVPSTPHHVLHALALETCRALSYLQSYLRNYKSTSPPSSSKSGWAVEIELEIEGVTDIPTVTRRLLDGYSRSSHILWSGRIRLYVNQFWWSKQIWKAVSEKNSILLSIYDEFTILKTRFFPYGTLISERFWRMERFKF